MTRNIKIPENLFTVLYKCFVVNSNGKCNNCNGCEWVRKQLEDKGNRIYDRSLYTKSKTAASAEEREKARQKYLDSRGVPKDFRY